MKYLLLLTMTFFGISSIIASAGNEADTYLDKALKAHVTDAGIVNYEGLKNDASFAKAIELYKSGGEEESWTKEEKMAYWINVYNAFTIQLILDNYPIKSITNLGSPWDKKFIEIQGEKYSLNQIEHEILRGRYKDPRIHFAVNCASYSCPKLHNKAFRAETLEATMEKLTMEFINDSKRNDFSGKKPKVSKLFEWYADDFKNGQSIVQFIDKYYTGTLDSGTKIQFLEYNWSLNNQ
ncbi:MAG: DUF547 domain-containing protein [Bacteroidota bacterium]